MITASAVSPDTRSKLLARIDDDEVVRLAKDLIRIPSFTTEETPCAEWLAGYLHEQGLEVTLQEIEPGRKQAIARLRGTGGGKSIMLNGHIDIDPLATGWTRDPFDPWIADGKLYGHGIYNMKGGVTACIMATLALRRAGIPLRGDVVLACVAAELNSGVGTVYALEHGQRTDMAVVAEPYGARTILTKHTGTMDVVIHTLGRATHISKKEHGVDAIGLMMRAIAALEAMRFTHVHDPDLPGLPRLNVGSIIGGRGRDHNLRGAYTVSDFCTAYVNVRFNASQTGETVMADIRRTLDGLAAADPRFRVRDRVSARTRARPGPHGEASRRRAQDGADRPDGAAQSAPDDGERARPSRGPAAAELRGQRHHASLGRGNPVLHLRPGRRLHGLSRRARRARGPLSLYAGPCPHRPRGGALTYVDPSTGRTYPLDEPRWRAESGHYLNLGAGPGLGRGDIDTACFSVWRYAKALLVEARHAVSLGEGWTPLIPGNWNGARVAYKLELAMPTGSFKDRGMTVMVSYLRSRGIRRVLEDSSGNAGASLSAYAAAAGWPAASSCPRQRRRPRSPRSPHAARRW